MSLPSTVTGTAFTTPTCVGATIEYPFRNNGDSATKIYSHIMQVKLTSYAPLADDDTMTTATQKPARSPFPDDSLAFYIGDSVPEPIDGGMVQFVRSFSNIPESRVEGAGLYGFTFPANNAGIDATFNCLSGTGDFLTSNNRVEIRFSLTSSNAANLGVGDRCQSTTAAQRLIFYGQTAFRDVYPFFVIYEKTSSGSNFSYKGYMENYQSVKSVNAYSNLSTFTMSLPKVLARASTETTNSESVFTYRYVKTANIEDEDLARRFNVLSRSGSNPNYTYTEQDEVTTSTFPHRDEYGGLAFVGGYLQAEPEVVNRWRGNIWKVTGRQVAAK